MHIELLEWKRNKDRGGQLQRGKGGGISHASHYRLLAAAETSAQDHAAHSTPITPLKPLTLKRKQHV